VPARPGIVMTLRAPGTLMRSSCALLACGIAVVSGAVTAQQCNPNSCQVRITVTGNCSNAGDITVAPDTLPVPRQFHQLKIHWEVQTEGFKFASAPNGVTFTTPPLPPANEFHSANATAGGRKYNLTDANTAGTPTDFKYNIQLLRADGSACAPKDPFIRNGAAH
jgi:hypothetical protein